MSNWKCESGTQCAQEADKQGLVRYGTAGVAVVTWTSKDKAPSTIHLSGSVTCPSCQTAASFETDCDTDCDLLSGPKVNCSKCSSRVDFSVWARKSDGAPRLFVTGMVYSRTSGTGATMPVVTINAVREFDAKQSQPSAPEPELPKTLHWAFDICQDKDKLRQALASGVNINARDEVGATALHKMATLGGNDPARNLLRVDAVRNLLESGADPNVHLNSGATTVDILSHNIQHEAQHRKEASEQILQLLQNPPPAQRSTATKVAAGGQSSKTKAGCFIATACYGSYDHPAVEDFRQFRDTHLNASPLGRLVVTLYYRLSPPFADYLKASPSIASVIRRCIFDPIRNLVGFLHDGRSK